MASEELPRNNHSWLNSPFEEGHSTFHVNPSINSWEISVRTKFLNWQTDVAVLSEVLWAQKNRITVFVDPPSNWNRIWYLVTRSKSESLCSSLPAGCLCSDQQQLHWWGAVSSRPLISNSVWLVYCCCLCNFEDESGEGVASFSG